MDFACPSCPFQKSVSKRPEPRIITLRKSEYSVYCTQVNSYQLNVSKFYVNFVLVCHKNYYFSIATVIPILATRNIPLINSYYNNVFGNFLEIMYLCYAYTFCSSVKAK